MSELKWPSDEEVRTMFAKKEGFGSDATLSAALELPEVRALVDAARKMLVASELREIYHRLPNDKNRIGDPKSPKAKAKDAWLKAFRRASSATSLAIAAIKDTKP